MDDSNLYSILQVDPAAGLDEVRAAYRRLAFLYHPDQSKDPEATRKMQALNAAYDVIGNPDKRLEYDRQRLAPPAPPAGEPVAPPAPPPEAAAPQAKPEPQRPPAEPVDPVVLEKRRRRRQKRLRQHLKVIAAFIVLTVALFMASLITGQISIAAIVMLVVMVGYILGVFILRIRNLGL